MKHKKAITGISLAAIAVTCFASGVLALNPKTTAASTEDGFHILGASVRISSNEEDRGIRFAFGLPEAKTGDGYTIGTLVITKEALGDKVLNHNDDNTDAVTVDYEPIDCSKNWIPHEKLDNAKEGYNYYNAALTNIPELNYDTTLVARSYYVKDGVYTYSDPVERSIGWVAAAALNNGENDTDNILMNFVTGGYGSTELTVAGEKELVTVEETTELTANNEKGYRPVWSSSDPEVATVDKNGKVTPKKGGETTVTATIGNVSASKTVYVVGEGLYQDQIGARINGYDMTNDPQYMTMSTGTNGEIVINAKFIASWDNYHAGLVWNNIESKAYYEALANAGYKYLSYDLKVEGADEDKVSDLYAFCGQQLTEIPQENGVYKVQMLVSDISRVYDAIQVNLPNGKRQGEIGTRHGMFLAWRDNRGTDRGVERNYIFTISNPKFVIPELSVDFAENSTELVEAGKTTTLTANANVTGDVVWSSSNNEIATVEGGVVTGVKGGEVTITATLGELTASKTIYVVGEGLYQDQIGIRIYGNDLSADKSYLDVVTTDGEMVITAKFQADATYAPALTIRNLYNKAYYQALIANGYTKLAFNLAVEGDLEELYVFGKAIKTFPEKDGVYTVSIDVQHFVTYYDTMYTIATGDKVGQASSISAKFITWKSPANDWATVRNYVFTISNAAFKAAPTLEVAADVAEIAYGETATLTATTNWNANEVIWSTSDETIATVGNGVVTVTGENWGEVTITATVANVSVETTITVKAPTQLEVDFTDGSKDIIEVGKTTTLQATTDWNANKVEWSSSNNEIATVVDGVVTGEKGGEVTITATLGELTASKTVYVVGEGLYQDQIGARINGWNMTTNTTYMTMETGENGEMIITAQFSDSAAYYPMLMLRNMYSKAYYEKLIAEGYKKLTFSLAVGGDNASNVSDLYVFGKALPTFAKNASGAYQIVVDVQYIVTYYDNIYGIATSAGQAGQSGSLDKMLIAWKSPLTWSGNRNYIFTISNTAFRKGVLFADDFGFRDGGVNKTYSDMKLDTGANGEIIIGVDFNATETYGSFLMFNKMDTITYLGSLKGTYASLTFELTVGGADYDKVSDLHVFGTAKALSTCNKVEGKENTYVVEIRLDMTYFTDSGWKTNMNTLMTSTGQAGSWNARSQMLLAWRYSGSSGFVNPNNQTRNYVFTIANFELRETLLYSY